jgi:hypothetical protein
MSVKKVILVVVLLIINQVVTAQDSLAVKGFIHALKFIEADISSDLSKSYQAKYAKDTLICVNAIISDDEIENNALLVLCDILKKQYNASENCSVLFGENRPLLQRVRDSIQSVQSENIEGYKLKYETTSQNEKKGYLLKFSRLVDNTLMAQIGYSSNLKEGFGSGKTTIYYFLFDDNLFINKVFKGSKFYD